jgi:hypothetical protein
MYDECSPFRDAVVNVGGPISHVTCSIAPSGSI